MIELKRLKLINWHNFENVTFDCARLTYMIGVNAVGKTTILDARYGKCWKPNGTMEKRAASSIIT